MNKSYKDRELLELAAKAAKAVGMLTQSWYGNEAYIDGMLSRWNPLEDDGDAFRLASRMNLEVDFGNNMVVRPYEWWGEGTDPYVATRLAIVRAAAEIGRGME